MFLRLLLPALLSLLATPAVAASAYPSKPIRIVVTYAAGGSTDVRARLLANPLTEILGWQIVIDNRGGAGASSAPRSLRARRRMAIRCSSALPRGFPSIRCCSGNCRTTSSAISRRSVSSS